MAPANAGPSEVPSFKVYVDESGDEGFVFKPNGSGSSRWFVLTAVVVRSTNDLVLVKRLKEIRNLLGKKPTAPIHFVHLKHAERVAVVKRLADLPVRLVSVAVHKPSITEPEVFQNEAYRLYRYATRLLLERVSWLCRDHRKVGEGNGFAEVIFSNRNNMSYDDIRAYLDRLLMNAQTDSSDTRLDPSVIRSADIRAVDHARLAGLQIADVAASSTFSCLETNRFGDTERSYLLNLKALLYRHKHTLLGYGLKVYPGSVSDLKTKAPEVENLEGL